MNAFQLQATYKAPMDATRGAFNGVSAKLPEGSESEAALLPVLPNDSVTLQHWGQSASAVRPTSSVLASIQDHTQGKAIHVRSVVADFKNTLSAIGVPDGLKTEIDTYLQAVSYQEGKAKPNATLVRHALKTAANSLDEFIADNLGHPSRVVRDWVDALLLQPLDFSQQSSPDAPTASVATSPEIWKAALKAGKQALDAQNPQGVMDTLGALLLPEPVFGRESGQDDPPADWVARGYTLLAKAQLAQGDAVNAMAPLQKAAQWYAQAEQPEKQLKALARLAQVQQVQALPTAAEATWREVVGLSRQTKDKAMYEQALTQLGQLYDAWGDTDKLAKVLVLQTKVQARQATLAS